MGLFFFFFKRFLCFVLNFFLNFILWGFFKKIFAVEVSHQHWEENPFQRSEGVNAALTQILSMYLLKGPGITLK